MDELVDMRSKNTLIAEGSLTPDPLSDRLRSNADVQAPVRLAEAGQAIERLSQITPASAPELVDQIAAQPVQLPPDIRDPFQFHGSPDRVSKPVSLSKSGRSGVALRRAGGFDSGPPIFLL